MKNQPVMLEDYVRFKRKKGLLVRGICTAGLLAMAVLLRLFLPHCAQAVRAWVFGDGQFNEAVAVFYDCAADGGQLPEAVEAFCLALDGQ